VIQEVEKLNSKLQLVTLREIQVPNQREIPVINRRAGEIVA
jgi:hypothetical protein